MTTHFRRILDDFRRRKNLDLYAAALVSLVFAALTLIGADLSDDIRWSLVFAALGLLVLRSALSNSSTASREDVFLDRTAYASNPIASRLSKAKEVWIFAPTAINLLTAERCEMLRKGPLSRADGSVRIVVLDDSDPSSLQMVMKQLDQLLEFPVQEVADALRETHRRLRAMGQWQVEGSFSYGTLLFSPGFSIVAIDPSSADGFLTVELHGFRNDTITSRMHIELTRRQDLRWYLYWLEQFDAIWRVAKRRTVEARRPLEKNPEE